MPEFNIYREAINPGVFRCCKVSVVTDNAREALKDFIAAEAPPLHVGVPRFIVMDIDDDTCHLLKPSIPRWTWDVVSA